MSTYLNAEPWFATWAREGSEGFEMAVPNGLKADAVNGSAVIKMGLDGGEIDNGILSGD